ncbi:MAG: helix-turn-helix domain-containing protein [Candidatus Limnocylindria bacterium]
MSVEPLAALQQATLKPSDVARRLDVERTTVYRWIKSGKLPSFELSGTTYILIAAYERFAERRKKGTKRVTLEQQAARYIGQGVEVAGDVDLYAGLTFPSAEMPQTSHEAAIETQSINDVRRRLRQQLDAFETRFQIASEHVHREYLVERHPHVHGVPDDVAGTWASCYAAYASLSLVHAH